MTCNSDFLHYQDELTDNGYKLICIHHAGGGASTFANWKKYLHGIAEVMPVQLPGRENRIDEPFLKDFDTSVELITNELAPYLVDRRFSLFGHSMGGIIAYEMAKRFEQMGLRPEKCFISSTLIDENMDIVPSEDLSDEDFYERVFAYGGISDSDELFQYPELKELFTRILRADFSFIENYRGNKTILKCPIEEFCGKSDPMECIEHMKDWKKYTESTLTCTEFEGGHFYFLDDCQEICRVISEKINLK